jgi:site-specific recombinase XerD
MAEALKTWRAETTYGKDTDWVFASEREKGRIPRAASCAGRKYLRAAAIKAGVIGKDEAVRFGWHSLRHSLATFLVGTSTDVKTVQPGIIAS